jgi:hypothetical protein
MELRKSNFVLGSNEFQPQSCSKEMLASAVEAPPPSSLAEKERIKEQMLRGNFVIGDEKNRSMKGAETSYKPAVAAFNRNGGPS